MGEEYIKVDDFRDLKHYFEIFYKEVFALHLRALHHKNPHEVVQTLRGYIIVGGCYVCKDGGVADLNELEQEYAKIFSKKQEEDMSLEEKNLFSEKINNFFIYVRKKTCEYNITFRTVGIFPKTVTLKKQVVDPNIDGRIIE